MMSPYREQPIARVRKQRHLDPWHLALLFAWVCDAWRIAAGLVEHRSVTGEIGFAGLLGLTTCIVLVASARARRRARSPRV